MSEHPPVTEEMAYEHCAKICDRIAGDDRSWPDRHTRRIAGECAARIREAAQAVAPPKETADTKRLDWLASEASKRGPVNSINVDVPHLVAVISYDPMWTLREAVDMAMGGEAVDVRTDKSSPVAPPKEREQETRDVGEAISAPLDAHRSAILEGTRRRVRGTMGWGGRV